MSESVDAILIDDDPLVRDMWALAAGKRRIKLTTYESAMAFFADIKQVERDVAIYIDFDLGAEGSGLEIGERLTVEGFTELYLTTGFPAERISRPSWLKGVLDKKPPWIQSS